MDDDLNKLKERFQLSEEGGSLYGTYGSYDLIIDAADSDGGKILIKFAVIIEGARGPLYEYIDRMQAQFAITSYKLEKEFLIFLYNPDNEEADGAAFIQNTIDVLDRLECRRSCLSCKQPAETRFYRINGIVSCLCENCAGEISQKIAAEAQKPDNYLIGTLGAVAGGIVGSAVWIILGLLHFYASFAGLAIAFAALWGYNLVKGRHSKTGAFIIIFAIVVSMLFAEYAGIFIQFAKEYPGLQIGQFLRITPQLLSDSGFISAILPNLGLGIVFAGLGSYRLIRDMYQNSQEKSDFIFERL